jgi:DHA1 family bicyclomycin/chloramphenicol resistance-like MFS transporter
VTKPIVAASGPPHVHVPAGLVLLLGALTAFAALSTDFYLPAFPSIGASLGATAPQVELTLAVFFVGVAVGQLFYGPLSDRVGRRRPLLGGLILYTAASIGCAFAPTVEALTFFRLLQALGGCAGIVLARAVVRDRYAAQQTAHIFSMLMLVMGLAPILAPLAGGALLLVADWRALFWALAAFGAVCTVAVALWLGESLPPSVAAQARTESPLGAYLALLRKPRLVGYMLYGAFASSALLTYIATSPDILIRTYGVKPEQFGWVFGANAIGLISCSQINRRLLRRYSYDRILVWSNTWGIVTALLLAVVAATGAAGLAGLLISLFLVIAGMGFNTANTLAGAMAVDPQRAGSTAALMGSCQFTMGALAAALAGALHDGTPRPMAGVVLCAMLAAAAALHFLAKPGRETAA